MWTQATASPSGRVLAVEPCRPRVRISRTAARADGSLESRLAPNVSKLPVLGLISAAIESQARVQQFEELAGRSAMVGVLVATVAEVATEKSVFQYLDAGQLSLVAGLSLGAVMLAAGVAAVQKTQMCSDVKEAVISSCTAVKRSASSVTQQQVDKAVDYIMDKAFHMGVLYSIIAEDELL